MLKKCDFCHRVGLIVILDGVNELRSCSYCYRSNMKRRAEELEGRLVQDGSICNFRDYGPLAPGDCCKSLVADHVRRKCAKHLLECSWPGCKRYAMRYCRCGKAVCDISEHELCVEHYIWEKNFFKHGVQLF